MEGWPTACREEKRGCRVVVQGVAVAAEIVGGANPGEKKRYGQRGCFREASGKS